MAPALGLGLGCAAAWSQSALHITSSVDLSVSYVDNNQAALQGSGGDIVTQVRPGVQITSRSGRVRGSLD